MSPWFRILALTVPILFASCATTPIPFKKKDKGASISGYRVVGTETGQMSWYSVRTNRGTSTASGERFNDYKPTAAHKRLKFGTMVRVTNLRNGKSTILRINDRGPYTRGRIIDVPIAFAQSNHLDFHRYGVAPCKVEVLEKKRR